MLVEHRQTLPAFVLAMMPRQAPLCVLTVLSINDVVGDCAAYRGIVPNLSDKSDVIVEGSKEDVRAGGEKLLEDEAKALFPIIEEKGLRYRR